MFFSDTAQKSEAELVRTAEPEKIRKKPLTGERKTRYNDIVKRNEDVLVRNTRTYTLKLLTQSTR